MYVSVDNTVIRTIFVAKIFSSTVTRTKIFTRIFFYERKHFLTNVSCGHSIQTMQRHVQQSDMNCIEATISEQPTYEVRTKVLEHASSTRVYVDLSIFQSHPRTTRF